MSDLLSGNPKRNKAGLAVPRFLLATLMIGLAAAQTAPDVSLTVEFDNFVWYADDGDATKLATVRERIPQDIPRMWTAFKRVIILADVIKVGGKPAAGTFVGYGVVLNSATQSAPVPGRPIADSARNQLVMFNLEIMTADRSQVGSLVGLYAGAAAPGPGVPRGLGILSVLGGSGAFAGARGQGSIVAALSRNINERLTSMAEDPAFRRVNGGGLITAEFHLSGGNPAQVSAAYHADFAPLTSSRPAQRGEVLILQVTGGWPTRPYLAPGTAFSVDPLQEVQIPVEVSIAGVPAEIVNKVGWPGTRDRYRLDIRVPTGVPSGEAALELTSAYVPAGPYRIQVQ